MYKAIISFVISAFVGLGIGYVVYDVILGQSDQQPQVAQTNESSSQTPAVAANKQTKAAAPKEQTADKQAPAKTVSADQDNILAKRGCLGCHSVEALNLKGGQVGPDLSHAFAEVQDKHGMPIDQFLTKPNSAVMSGVIGNKPLTDDERNQVLEMLKKASETK